MIRYKKGGDSMVLTFLLVVILVLVFAAWTSFLNSSSSFGDISANVSITLSQIEFNQQYLINEAKLIANQTISSGASGDQLKSKFIQVASTHSLDIEQEGNFFAKINNSDFTFVSQGNNFTLSIAGVNIEAQNPTLQIKRVFDINITFDRNGNVLA